MQGRLEMALGLLGKVEVHLSDGFHGCYFCDGATVPAEAETPHLDDCPLLAIAAEEEP